MMQEQQTDYFREWLTEQARVKRMLLIDDSMDDCILIQRYTFAYHCEWVIANNITNAEFAMKRMAQLGGFALIFLDMNLNGRGHGGVDAFVKIKEQYPDVPIVVLSGHLTTVNIGEITKHGFAMFAQKPDSFSDKYFKELFRIMNIPLRPHYVEEEALQSP